jgi:hypothetical protein
VNLGETSMNVVVAGGVTESKLYSINPTTFGTTFVNNYSASTYLLKLIILSNIDAFYIAKIPPQNISRILHIDSNLSVNYSNIDLSYNKMVLNPNHTRAFVWNDYGHVAAYDVNTYDNTFNWTPLNTPTTTNAISDITFSADSELVILETDSFNSLEIVNLSSLLTVYSIRIDDVINYAHFLNSSSQQIVVHGQKALLVVDLPTGTQYEIPYPITANNFEA